MTPKKLYVRKLDIDIFDEEVNATRAWVANRPNTGRREYTDLSQVWHPADEEPELNRWLLIKREDSYYNAYISGTECIKWKEFVYLGQIEHWAYIDDLLPKGGEE